MAFYHKSLFEGEFMMQYITHSYFWENADINSISC